MFIFLVYMAIERDCSYFRPSWPYCVKVYFSGLLDHTERMFIFKAYLTIESECMFSRST